MRIGQVGMRPKPFCSVIFNEGELLQKFGIEIVPINLAVIIDRYSRILEERDDELAKGAEILKNMYEMDDLSPPLLKRYTHLCSFIKIFLKNTGCMLYRQNAGPPCSLPSAPCRVRLSEYLRIWDISSGVKAMCMGPYRWLCLQAQVWESLFLSLENSL